jgi:hypothetical protein
MMSEVLRKISRSQLRAWTIGHLKSKQGGKCKLCEKVINIGIMGAKSDYVADHDHITGEIRGVLCRGCNGAEGKVFTAVATWGKQSFNTNNVAVFLDRLSKYLLSDGCGIMYPDHRNEEEKQLITKQKAARATALRAAKLKLKKERDSGSI